MNHETRRNTAMMVGVLAAVALLSACNHVAESKQASAQALERVELKRVCMVNDTAFERDQIPRESGQRHVLRLLPDVRGATQEGASRPDGS